ncbi:MAG: hypothetical protein HRU38_06740 [Saccharospirillaceae bacterium]|nr:hypothetical protein [Pseudomonadales bacterium]NRB78351.1 hypothetical protein [Saccharospirillaceae bacterium]
MKIITMLILLLSFPVMADDLIIKDAQFACTNIKQNSVNDPFKYSYGVEIILKNNGVIPIILLTKINGIASIPFKSSDEIKIRRTLSYNETRRRNSLIIPPAYKLDLVELLPGDETMISYQFSSKEFVSKSNFEYFARAAYGGRFNNWVGRLRTKEINTQRVYQCKT